MPDQRAYIATGILADWARFLRFDVYLFHVSLRLPGCLTKAIRWEQCRFKFHFVASLFWHSGRGQTWTPESASEETSPSSVRGLEVDDPPCVHMHS